MTEESQRGSATVEFVGVGILLTLCTLGVLQTSLIAHVSAIVTDSAISGAAYAALADSSLPMGIDRARSTAIRAVPDAVIDGISASRVIVANREAIAVTIDYRIPMVGPWIAGARASVTGRAFAEER